MKRATARLAPLFTAVVVIPFAFAMHSLGGDDATKTGVYSGTLEEVNLTDQTITVKGRERTKTFRASENTAISTLEKKEKPTLKDLRTGLTVEVAYSEASGGTAMASSITEIKAPGGK